MGKRLALIYTLYFLCLTLLISLGSWQWYRGASKAELESLIGDTKEQYSTVDQAPQNWPELNYRQVRLSGTWRQDKTFLMDNRTFEGRQGLNVYSPFVLSADHSTILVNRGWLDKADNRKNDKINDVVSGTTTIAGTLYLPEKGFTLGEAYTDQSSWPRVIQYFDVPALSSAMNELIQPVVLVLDSGNNGAFLSNWRPYVVDSNRHYGYAMQWWGLAVTLAVFGLIWRRLLAKPS